MKLTFSADAWDDYVSWQTIDRKVLARLNNLLKECTRTPFTAIGKPEPWRGELAGWWSRRLTEEHRLIYRVTDDTLLIAQCRRHY